MKMTTQDAINRGYNMLACTALFVVGLSFSPVASFEGDLSDKLDDIGLAVVGIVALIWYLVGRNRFKRSVVPLALSALAVAIQVLGMELEFGDSASFGDNIGGFLVTGSFFMVLLVQFLANRRHLAAAAEDVPAITRADLRAY
jgi:hypothetical protein